MKDGRKQLLRRGVLAASAIGMLFVTQPTIAGADDVDAEVDTVTFDASVPIGPISVPVNFKLCSGSTCVQDETIPAQSGGTLAIQVTGQPSTVAHASAVPADCPKTEQDEQLSGAVINLTATGDTASVLVGGSFTHADGTVRTLGPISVDPGPQEKEPSLRLCALFPVET